MRLIVDILLIWALLGVLLSLFTIAPFYTDPYIKQYPSYKGWITLAVLHGPFMFVLIIILVLFDALVRSKWFWREY